jgi:hypothetical protein
MNFTKVAAPILLCAVVSACAKQPENIAAVPMDTASYERMSCRSLAAEEAKITAELNALSAAQKSAANSDALGVFLLGIPWSSMSGNDSSMSGNDKEALIAVAKGRVDAINTVQASKGCSG